MAPGGSKHWCFTINNRNRSNVVVFDESTMLYLVQGFERGAQNQREHIQGYVCFKNRTTLGSAKRLLGDSTAHLESKRGSVQEASDYCKKDGDFQEDGKIPEEQTARASKRGAELWREAKDLAEAGKIEDIDPELQVRYIRNFERIEERARLRRAKYDLLPGSICGVWLRGHPGLGKSFYARSFCRDRGLDYFLKPLTKWWDGYSSEPVVILEDVDHFAAKHIGHSLKLWADEAPFVAEVKGGHTKLRPLLIFVTSNYTIPDLWPDDLVLQEAIKRRFFEPVIHSRADFGEIHWPEDLSIIKNGTQKVIPPPPYLPSSPHPSSSNQEEEIRSSSVHSLASPSNASGETDSLQGDFDSQHKRPCYWESSSIVID